MVSTAALYALALLCSSALASPLAASLNGLDHRAAHRNHHGHVHGRSPRPINPPSPYSNSTVIDAAAARRARRAVARRCAARNTTSSTSTTSSAPNNVGGSPSTTSSAASPTTSSSGGGGGGGGGGAGKPANWPTVTQAGPTYAHTVATASDPYLTSISEALNFNSVPAYNEVHNGDLTYYDTGYVGCGDYYENDSYTAAVSHILWENWPGSDASVDTDRATICGPFVPGRSYVNAEGGYSPAPGLQSSIGTVIIGGDGAPNCQTGVGKMGQCHIPRTATVTNPANGKSCVVKIVDKCAGCSEHDLDVTPTVFAYLSDMSLGRVPISWKFNHF